MNYPQSYMLSAMFSKVIAFMMFVNDDLGEKDCTNKEMKMSLYQGICRELGA